MAGKKKELAEGSGSHYVLLPFRNKENWNDEYIKGQDVSHLDDDRLLELMDKGLVTDDAEAIAELLKDKED